MDAESIVDKLIPLFLEGDLERFNVYVVGTQTSIRDNHTDIVNLLDGKIDDNVLRELKEKLKLNT